MRPRTCWLVVLALLAALAGQCADTDSSEREPPGPAAVTVAAGCDPQGAAP